MKSIVAILVSAFIFLQCNNVSDSNSTKDTSFNDSILINKKRVEREKFISDSIYRNSSEYKLRQKKITELELKKDKMKAKYQKIIDDCYEWTTFKNKKGYSKEYTFNSNKYGEIMINKGFKPGEHTYDYIGEDGFYIIKIDFGQPTPTSSGWKHNWKIDCTINEEKIK